MPHTYAQVRFAPYERHGAMYGSYGATSSRADSSCGAVSVAVVASRAQSTARRTLDRVAHCTLGQAAHPDSDTPKPELRKERGLFTSAHCLEHGM